MSGCEAPQRWARLWNRGFALRAMRQSSKGRDRILPGTDYWGHGIATEAIALVTDWAFGAHQLLRIFAQPFTTNVASRRVLEKAGHVLEGMMKRSAVNDGAVLDPARARKLRVGRRQGTSGARVLAMQPINVV